MKMMGRYWMSTCFALLMGCLAVACSDDTDTTGQAGSESCAEGEFYNSLTGECDPEVRDDNAGGPNNGASGDDNTNNGAPDDDAGDAGASPDDEGEGDGGDDSDDTNDPGGDPPESCGPGAIVGKACAPSGETLGGAEVTLEGVDCDGDTFSQTTQTNTDGDFEFDDVPAGRHTLTVSTGSFSRDQVVVVRNGETVDLTASAAKVCLDGASVEIAVIEGAYDHVSGVLDDLQVEYTIVGNDQPSGFFGTGVPSGHTFLMDPAAMNQYDIIFINCGELWNNLQSMASGDEPTVIANLQSYLSGGNSLYVSDWAHPFIEKVYPDAVDFAGDDDEISQARRGYAPQTITASVVSNELQSVLGHSQATIDFPHTPPLVLNNNWAVAEGADPASTIHLEGDAQTCAPGDECSSEGGSPSDSQPNAPLLVTYQDPAGGTAIFTSFHNEHQATINQDMENILKFLIFQL